MPWLRSVLFLVWGFLISTGALSAQPMPHGMADPDAGVTRIVDVTPGSHVPTPVQDVPPSPPLPTNASAPVTTPGTTMTTTRVPTTNANGSFTTPPPVTPNAGTSSSPNTALTAPAGDGVLRLRLALHELILLQRAAREAGGDLRITIDPVGITTEDLIVPLARDPELLVKRDGDTIVVTTRSPEAVGSELREEVKRLEERRRLLLQDINVLERVTASAGPKTTVP